MSDGVEWGMTPEELVLHRQAMKLREEQAEARFGHPWDDAALEPGMTPLAMTMKVPDRYHPWEGTWTRGWALRNVKVVKYAAKDAHETGVGETRYLAQAVLELMDEANARLEGIYEWRERYGEMAEAMKRQQKMLDDAYARMHEAERRLRLLENEPAAVDVELVAKRNMHWLEVGFAQAKRQALSMGKQWYGYEPEWVRSMQPNFEEAAGRGKLEGEER